MDKKRFAVYVLMNKLLEKKRYNDVMILAQHELAIWKKELISPGFEFTNIVPHAALELVSSF